MSLTIYFGGQVIAPIVVRGARLHNLKNVNLTIPKNKLVVFTGLSGSGKSTLAFDILHKESQRQYLETLGYLGFKLTRPPVDLITGLSPSISLDQRLTNHNPRSTVGTYTDVYTYLRVLFARLGHRPCPVCGEDIPPLNNHSSDEWRNEFVFHDDVSTPETTFPCPKCSAPVPEIGMENFSFNKPAGACPTCTGLGIIQTANLSRLVDEQKSIQDGAVFGWDSSQIDYHASTLRAAAAHYGLEIDLSLPIEDFTTVQRDLLLYGVKNPIFSSRFPKIHPPATVRQGRFEGIVTNLLRRVAERIEDSDYFGKMGIYLITQTCPDCNGSKLRPDSLKVTVNQQNITSLSGMTLQDLILWLNRLPFVLSADEKIFADPIRSEMNERLTRLIKVGAGYLTMDRSMPSISAGESQRLRLAAMLGSSLNGILYVFDEPTIGTHPRDIRKLIETLKELRDLGNTVLVIEHDLEVIAAADYLIDFGPGAGKHGGVIVAAGSPAKIAKLDCSLTARFLYGRTKIPIPTERRVPTEKAIIIHGARHHNLDNITVSLPLGLLVAVTGVSGSGKSSLIFDILDHGLRQRIYGSSVIPGEHDFIEGSEFLDKIITINQQQIGRQPHSITATYTDTFTPIRTAFAATSDARRRGISARHFSMNISGGRCEQCQGEGFIAVNMHFMPDVEVRCPSCHGRRFNNKTLSVLYNGYNISQVLDLTIEEALDLFREIPAARSRLQVMSDIGLGYLQLGQSTATLSGGEGQRIKLAKELGKRSTGHTLYLLDEPTTGLHLADINRLVSVLQRLVDMGNSVVFIEHNLDLIKTADWVIDLGPEGGPAGGKLVAEGTPETVSQFPGSLTGLYLKEHMKKSSFD